MSKARQKLGKWGESVAATFLEAHGYRIIGRNWRTTIGEIDIIAQLGEQLAFVEVKTRRGRANGTPEEAITPRKAAKMREVAWAYLTTHELDDETDFSIDLIAIELAPNGKLQRCEHHKNVIAEW